MMDYDGYEGIGWMVGGGLMMMLVWIGLIALVVWGVGSQRGGQRPSAHDEPPVEILRRRYASGEISQDEFEQAGRVLMTSSHTTVG